VRCIAQNPVDLGFILQERSNRAPVVKRNYLAKHLFVVILILYFEKKTFSCFFEQRILQSTCKPSLRAMDRLLAVKVLNLLFVLKQEVDPVINFGQHTLQRQG